LTASFSTALAQITTTGALAAPNYDSFVPPAAGGTYVDPVFGSTIKRVSNALATPNADRGGMLSWIQQEYATSSPFNSDNSRFILVHQSYFGLYDGAGAFLRNLPLEINSSSEPRWSRRDASTLYYHYSNQLKSYNIASSTTSVVHTFSEYGSISGNGEMDISQDGDHFVFAGDGRYVFVYEISTDKKYAAFDTAGRAFDSLYVTPDNHVTITWMQAGTARYSGIELFDINMSFLRQVAHAGGHMDVTRDTNGDEVLVWTNSNDATPIANCNNGIVKIRLADARQTCLLQLDWNLAVHISAPDGNGSVFVDTEAPANPTPGGSGWVAYTNELLQVKLDGSGATRWAHHRSRPLNSYNWQPKLAINRDGSRLLYSSDYDLQNISGYTTEYGDTYMLVLDGSATTTTPPPDTGGTGGTGTGGTGGTTTLTTSRLEQDNAAIQYTGTWYPNAGAFNSGSSAVMAMDPSNSARLNFTGTGVKWIGYRDAWSGLADVFVDGVLKATVDTYSANDTAQAVQYSISDLTNAAHTLTIVPKGQHSTASAGSWVWVDAFDVTSGSTTVVTPPVVTDPPVSTTPYRIEQSAAAVVYTGGTWSTNTTAPSSGGSSKLSMDPGARATVTFTGTAVNWIAYRDQWSGMARVYVDGVLKSTVDTYNSPARGQQVMYSATGLTRGTHTLAIEVVGQHSKKSSGNWVWIDAFDVTP
jgi:hypothetical protein